MYRVLLIVLASAVALMACGSSGSNTTVPNATQVQADLYAIDQIEVTWHKASSTKDLDLMMSLWAEDATFTVGSQTYTGKQQIHDFFANNAASFKPENHWLSETPAYKVHATVDGDKGTLHFECHYVDIATRVVKAVVGADMNVARINNRWLITSAVNATPILSA